jgi:hypothetical protein
LGNAGYSGKATIERLPTDRFYSRQPPFGFGAIRLALKPWNGLRWWLSAICSTTNDRVDQDAATEAGGGDRQRGSH